MKPREIKSSSLNPDLKDTYNILTVLTAHFQQLFKFVIVCTYPVEWVNSHTFTFFYNSVEHNKKIFFLNYHIGLRLFLFLAGVIKSECVFVSMIFSDFLLKL